MSSSSSGGHFGSATDNSLVASSSSSLGRHFALTAESPLVSDVSFRAGALTRSSQDVFSISESILRLTPIVRNVTEVFLLSSSNSGLGSHFAGTAEAIGLRDLNVRSAGFSRASSDSDYGKDSSVRLAAHLAVNTEPIFVSDLGGPHFRNLTAATSELLGIAAFGSGIRIPWNPNVDPAHAATFPMLSTAAIYQAISADAIFSAIQRSAIFLKILTDAIFPKVNTDATVH